ncbi:MAG: AAA family ATPase [Calothrix sp. MO_192.B10]|nr:AAA family ATPase [Calothrix sp. MO_192.B10]
MEAIIFIGIQGAGKSSFYRQHFLDTHIRINLDMLKTRHREKILFQACLEAKQRLVVDNTNPTLEDRSRYIQPAKAKGFRVLAYYFQSPLEECKQRNNQRPIKQIVPIAGLLATHKKLIIPTLQEGFDSIYIVNNCPDYSFIIEELNHAKLPENH